MPRHCYSYSDLLVARTEWRIHIWKIITVLPYFFSLYLHILPIICCMRHFTWITRGYLCFSGLNGLTHNHSVESVISFIAKLMIIFNQLSFIATKSEITLSRNDTHAYISTDFIYNQKKLFLTWQINKLQKDLPCGNSFKITLQYLPQMWVPGCFGLLVLVIHEAMFALLLFLDIYDPASKTRLKSPCTHDLADEQWTNTYSTHTREKIFSFDWIQNECWEMLVAIKSLWLDAQDS